MVATASCFWCIREPKPEGWTDSVGKALLFDEVVVHRRAMVIEISGSSLEAPQPEIAVLNVSSFSAAKTEKVVAKVARTAKRKKAIEA
jgi:hypothetical protein